VGNIYLPNVELAVNSHAYDQAAMRRVDYELIDQIVKKINSVAPQLDKIASNEKVWVYDPEHNVGFGLRRLLTNQRVFALNTVVASRPYDGSTTIIELPRTSSDTVKAMNSFKGLAQKGSAGMSAKSIPAPPIGPSNNNARGGGISIMNPDPLAQLMRESDTEAMLNNLQALKNRCTAILARVVAVLDEQDQVLAAKVRVIVDPTKRGSPASAKTTAIIVGPAFQDAPDEVITWMIGHELAHIIKGHKNVGTDNKVKPPQDIRQQEVEADDLANVIMKRLNITKAGVWTWIERERGGIERRLRWDATPTGQEWNRNSTHPSINDRIQNARQHGIELSRAELQDRLAQLDQLGQTLA
jgi:hypothetical protein